MKEQLYDDGYNAAKWDRKHGKIVPKSERRADLRAPKFCGEKLLSFWLGGYAEGAK